MSVAHSSSGLGYCPLKAETGVRLPYALPFSRPQQGTCCVDLTVESVLFLALHVPDWSVDDHPPRNHHLGTIGEIPKTACGAVRIFDK